MSDPRGSLNTRWSLLDGLRGAAAEEAWRWFIERYHGYIRTCLGRLIAPPDRAAAAAEEIWSYLFESAVLENADRSLRFRAYLAGTVRNYARAWSRKNATSTSSESADEPVETADPASEFEAQELRLWKAQVVKLALEELGKRHPEQVLALRWFYGLATEPGEHEPETRSASWIAERLGIRANAVHQMIFRGRKRLRSCIENELRETVRSEDDLDDEMRLVYGVIRHENPGLEG